MANTEKTETHIIAGAVLERDGKFLLIQEAKASCRGKWNFPAGHLDPGESITEAMLREVHEESGFIVEPTGICQIGSRKLPNVAFISVFFTAKIISGEIKYDPAEILDVKWLSYEEILVMKDQLRNKVLILDAIKNVSNGVIAPLEILSNYDS